MILKLDHTGKKFFIFIFILFFHILLKNSLKRRNADLQTRRLNKVLLWWVNEYDTNVSAYKLLCYQSR